MKSQQTTTYQFRLSEDEYLILAEYVLQGMGVSDEDSQAEVDRRDVANEFVRYFPVDENDFDHGDEGVGESERPEMPEPVTTSPRHGFLRKKTG